MDTMSTSEDDVKYAETRWGKDSKIAQMLRNSRAGEGRTANDLYVTGSMKKPAADHQGDK